MNLLPILKKITDNYRNIKIGVLGDICLDRYFEIDPDIKETSIETGMPVYNVVKVRAQPGGAGTIIMNLSALGVSEIYPIGFAGEDGEGFELETALKRLAGVKLDYFFRTPQRVTFTYGKPLLMHKTQPPQELNRLDIKNWTPTPMELRHQILQKLQLAWRKIDALMILEQTEMPETGVICNELLYHINELVKTSPAKPVIADSRRGLKGWPTTVSYKMNKNELQKLSGNYANDLVAIAQMARQIALNNKRPIFITLAEQGMIGCDTDGTVYHMPALPLRGPIDIVGAGDAVSANLIAALAAGASVEHAILLASLAASIVIHQLGTTGTATVEEILKLHELYPIIVPRRLI